MTELQLKEYLELISPETDYQLHLRPMSWRLWRYIHRRLKLIVTPTFENLPNYGELYTLKEFIEYCKDGDLIDSDGFGNYSLLDKMSDIPVKPSDVIVNQYRKDFSHVVWFNR